MSGIMCSNNQQFRCLNGINICSSLRCNCRNDCGDFSDETNCTVCPGCMSCGVFNVGFGQRCIESRSICDGFRDCTHGEDELASRCLSPGSSDSGFASLPLPAIIGVTMGGLMIAMVLICKVSLWCYKLRSNNRRDRAIQRSVHAILRNTPSRRDPENNTPPVRYDPPPTYNSCVHDNNGFVPDPDVERGDSGTAAETSKPPEYAFVVSAEYKQPIVTCPADILRIVANKSSATKQTQCESHPLPVLNISSGIDNGAFHSSHSDSQQEEPSEVHAATHASDTEVPEANEPQRSVSTDSRGSNDSAVTESTFTVSLPEQSQSQQ